MIIAIDGPAASGKGTIARQVAAVYGLRHLDTGLLYRAVAKAVLEAGYSPDDAARATEAAIVLDPRKFDDNALKLQAITQAARRSARRPRHRHRHRSRRRREVIRHRDAGSARRPARP